MDRKTLVLTIFLIASVSRVLGQRPANAVSITDFGAHCDWNEKNSSAHDDTDAIAKAINHSPGIFALLFPSGNLCRITAPIQVPYNVSFFGYGPGSGIVADYSAWKDKSDFHAIELVDKTGRYSLGQTFEDLSITGFANANLQSTGFYASDKLANPAPSGGDMHYICGIQVRNLAVQTFDTAFQIEDITFSLFDFIQVANVRAAFVMLGQNLNTVIEHLYANYFNTSATSNKSTTIGLLLDQKQYPRQVLGPEGITLSNSIIIGANENIVVNVVYQMNVVDNILDGASGDAVVLVNPNNINFERNYVATNGVGHAGILVKGGTNLDGLNISNNLINGSGPANKQNGIYFLPGYTHRNAHIENNRIQTVATAMVFASLPTHSSIKGNYGWANGTNDAFIVVKQIGACGQGTTIEQNTTTDSVSILSAKCTGFRSDSSPDHH